MSNFQTARARHDTRGQHIAAEHAKALTTVALAKHVYGSRKAKYRALKKMMEGK